MTHLAPSLFATVLLASALAAEPLPGFTPSAPREQSRLVTPDENVRLYQNAPEDFDPRRPTHLILYATPNGNSLEQTLGAKPAEDGQPLDWHFDIQHVAAQVRTLRRLDPTVNYVLAVVQPEPKSWPAFRAQQPDKPRRVAAIVEAALAPLPPETTLTLTGHSGGGSFIFAFINAADMIPPRVRRIAFLDANYSYSDEPDVRHGDKLLAWLNADRANHLVVIAYDDRNITFDGKPVVGPTGGTFRATGRMTARFAKDVTLTTDRHGPFDRQSALDGRAQFFVHPNPDNKILHTALVGEMNGLLHALTVATPLEEKWGTLGGPRAYTDHVTPAPSVIPPRPTTAPTGSAFAKIISTLAPADREQAILAELMAGNVPDFLRHFKTIRLTHAGHLADIHVTPDYLAVGSDVDFLRIPMTPRTARRIADAWHCSLPTRPIVDAIYRHADVKLAPRPMTESREAVETFLEHQRLIESARNTHPLGFLTAGIKKDLVLTNRLFEKPNRVAIYGWHNLDGTPIQPLTTVHVATYVDYSHAVRLVAQTVTLDGKPTTLDAILKNPALCPLASDEGPMDCAKMYGP